VLRNHHSPGSGPEATDKGVMMKAESGLDRASLLEAVLDEDPQIREILEGSGDPEEARDRLLSYLAELESSLRFEEGDDRLGLASALRAIEVFKGIVSPANEELVRFSALSALWAAAHGMEDDDLEPGFFEEFLHIIRGINGKGGIGVGWLSDRLGPDLPPDSVWGGRKGAVLRSRFLDRLAEEMEAAVGRYPTGLDEDVIAARRENRRRILSYFAGSDADWDDPAWHAEHVLKGEEGWRALQRLVPLTGEEVASVRLAVRYGIPWGITPYYLSLFDFDSSDRSVDYQIRSQVIPSLHTVRAMIEHRQDRYRAFDYMRERDTSPIPRVTRRYPAVAIFKVANTCPQICTYCQRNWEISDAMVAAGIPDREALAPALNWFEEHEGITDVLLTGGDPLVLDDRTIAYLLGRFSRMEHIRHIRIGTRVPVTIPMRVTDKLAELLGAIIEPGRRDLSLVTHVESPYEVTPELASAVARLRRHGIRVYNQQVFTLETSRRFQTVANRIALKRVGIDPYYTFYAKGKDEHRDLLVPIARLVQERKEEARLLPGIFRTDEPVFNVPGLGKNHLRAAQDRELIGILPDGRRVYLFHPWEKGIVPVEPWVYVDVSISEYLRTMEERGEDSADYESIWYYY